MMKILVNYANDIFKPQQRYNSYTGRTSGGFDKVLEYSPKDIEIDFYNAHKDILDNSRGGGYWLWKPYFILKALAFANEGDYIFYCDAGSYFVQSIDNIINCCINNMEDIVLFESPLLNIQFSKSSFINYLGLECEPSWLYGNQTTGGFILLKKSEKSLQFANEFLRLCQNKTLIVDPDLKEIQKDMFIGHRHDQTILSYLAWKNKIEPFRDPSQYGKLPVKYISYGINIVGLNYTLHRKYESSTYPIIVHLYRKQKLYNWMPRILFQFKLKIQLKLSEIVLGY